MSILSFIHGSSNGITALKNTIRLLKRKGTGKHKQIDLKKVPFFMTEGDSWFALPIHYNTIDFLELSYPDGLFLRFESNGDLLSKFLSAKKAKKLLGYAKTYKPDAILLSGGGNDLVDELQIILDQNIENSTPEELLIVVKTNGFFERMARLYQDFSDKARAIDPKIQVFAHSYDYPLNMGATMPLTIGNIGLAGLLVREIGSWISPKISKALPSETDQITFTRLLIDSFHDEVLLKVNSENFHPVDLRQTIADAEGWNDEMHPTQESYQLLAEKFKKSIEHVLSGQYRGFE